MFQLSTAHVGRRTANGVVQAVHSTVNAVLLVATAVRLLHTAAQVVWQDSVDVTSSTDKANAIWRCVYLLLLVV